MANAKADPRARAGQEEEDRLEALRSYDILDTDAEQSFDDLTLLASRICETPIALVSLVDEGRQWFKSKVGLEATETPREWAFCHHAIGQPEIMVVPDALNDSRFATNPLVRDDPKIRFYAGAPLTVAGGFRVGTLCVIDRVTRELSAVQMESLEALSRQVVSQLALRQQVVDLRTARSSIQEQQQRWQARAENTFDHLMEVNDQARILWANPNFCGAFGLQPDDVVGINLFEAVLAEDRAKCEAVFREAMANACVGLTELRYRRTDGSVGWFESSGQPFRSADGGQRAVIVSRDITERKRSQRQREDFVAMVTHDIRGAVSHIGLGIDCLESEAIDGRDEGLLDLLGPIRRASDSLHQLITNYLDAAKIEVGELVVRPARFELGTLLHRIAERYASTASRRRVAVHVAGLAGDVPLMGDEGALERVFTNLLSNALKHSPAGGRVTVEVDTDAKDVLVRVIDEGPGVRPQQVEQIFDRYAQTDEGRSHGGSGLGLFIVKSFVEAHGGTVTACSAARGGRFEVRLPRAGAHESAAADAAPAVHAEALRC